MALYDETDIATLVRSRELADKIVRELEATKSVRIPYVATPVPPAPPAIDPEELLPPPPSLPPSNIYETTWSATMPIAAAPALLKKPAQTTVRKPRRRKRKARSHLHWAVLAMCVAIGIGLWRDPLARANAKRAFTAESHRVVKAASAKASALKASAASTAKRVSARVI